MVSDFVYNAQGYIIAKKVRGVDKGVALAAHERCLDSHLDYDREEWDNKLCSLFG